MLQLPVGIIVAAVGGTPVRAWMSQQSLATIPGIKLPAVSTSPKDPAVLYNGMIHPLANVKIRGRCGTRVSMTVSSHSYTGNSSKPWLLRGGSCGKMIFRFILYRSRPTIIPM
ncbi:sialate O-acetylesterase [Niabella ginsengisoli]|uniref:Sialate O-acetylesterase n=1 Tax=Niabella ginsengisoli TaxID=522298 RepID=A0ABS9SJ42_9BACT|nr:sialate O-acetylesterase [Niabella ginsengisoli]MCH5598383.1 sialate O-acetylesterase [Niabella ginsengisoli]